eukprot:CAMPEP_0175078846 /NCGR_PEP_ID=MMETSP0052_2-20121109/24417_1 /TAXON_ID=51329 ORGANISM="Polytomella parva, Strain SAG 63-3" /NCGR_SAMPLE_ID=MMETSP0052_2 /ASSEMBLY_ACC=CAM_ASM_000194 /LENGTH=76 /DNA_ID=CAMNT_0016348957 /DNA_START=86 /DNA_END=316 /DNA_ORIENTATION=+
MENTVAKTAAAARAANSKFAHPWLAPLPAGRAKVYDLAYKTVTVSLALLSGYTLFEVCRGSFFILNESQPSSIKKE